MNAVENYLACLNYQKQDYVPRGNEPVTVKIDLFEETWTKRKKVVGKFTDDWQTGWEVRTSGVAPFAIKHPLSDLSNLSYYSFPDPDKLKVTSEIKSTVAKAHAQGKLVFGDLKRLLYERVYALMGMDNFLVGLLLQPYEIHSILHEIAQYARKVFERYMELGVDGVCLSEDLGTQRQLIMSPMRFREFLLPEYDFIFSDLRAQDKIIFFHSCGHVEDIIEDLSSVGVSILNPIQHSANNLTVIKKKALGRIALAGGISSEILMNGTPTDTKIETEEVLKILKPGGGWICMPDQIFPNMPEANLSAMWQTAIKLGRYE